MKLSDIVTILKHTFRWAFIRALRRKYRQTNGAPQGAQFVVGLVELLGNQSEHHFYVEHIYLKKEISRWRWLDDIIL